jgi:molybdopterin/thiamine biosynthesis adenylyltransferase/rhodanese-related sulfurtransferase
MVKSGKDLLSAAKAGLREVDTAYVKALLDRKASSVILDVREPDETKDGTIPGAAVLPRGFLELRVEKLCPERECEVVVYCAGGNRSAFAARTLMDMGYADVKSMAGGFGAWSQAKLPVAVPATLTPAQSKRYSRHLMIPEVGPEGQARLLASRVVLVGAGGLGSPIAYYLAAAGVGRLDLVDSDVVDETNLQRQILHKTRGVGKPKAESARETLLELNPDLDIRAHVTRLGPDNVNALFKDADVVVDGCDNFNTRYLVNDAAWRLGKPNVSGSIFRFEGQVTVFKPGEGPCYRCLFPTPPPPDFAPG